MKKPRLIEITALMCGVVLLALNLAHRGIYPSFRSPELRTRLWEAALLFGFFGTLVSLSWVFARWKELGIRSFLPLAITLGFASMSMNVPKLAFPPRDLAFFESHFSNYQEAIADFTGEAGNPPTEGRYALPPKYSLLSEDGHIWVITKEGHVNYFFLYEQDIRYNGVFFAPNEDVVFRPIYGPIRDHTGWYQAQCNLPFLRHLQERRDGP